MKLSNVFWWMIVVNRVSVSEHPPKFVPWRQNAAERELLEFSNVIQLLDKRAELKAQIAAVRGNAKDLYQVTQ